MAEQKIGILINAKDQASSVMKKFSKTMEGFSKKTTEVGKSLSLKLSVPLMALGTGAVMQASKLETLETSLESMLGSTEKAEKTLKSLVNFTAKTPFQLEGVGQATKQLLAFGVSEDRIESRLKVLGDISSGANVPLSDMAQIFGKIKAKGKAMTEEILQLSDRGVPIIDVLAKKFGVAKDEIFKMASEGKISFDVVTEALTEMTEKGGIFENQMQKQSSTMAGLFSTLKDNISLSMAELGLDIIKTFDLKEKIKSLTTTIQNLTEKFSNLSPTVKKAIVIVGGISIMAGPVLASIGMISTGITALGVGLTALSGPVGIVIMAVSAMALAWETDFLGMRSTLESFGETLGSHLYDFVQTTKSVFSEISETSSSSIDSISDYLSDKLLVITQGWKSAWTGMKDFFAGVWYDIVKYLEDKVNVAVKILNKLIEGINKIPGVSVPTLNLVSFAGEDPREKNLSKRQFGGPVLSGSSYWVGEKGPELFTPNQSGRIVPNGQISGSAPQITVNITGNTIDSSERVEELKRAIVSSLSRDLKLNQLGV